MNLVHFQPKLGAVCSCVILLMIAYIIVYRCEKPFIHKNIAVFYQKSGDLNLRLKYYDKAIKDYSKAIELNPSDSENYQRRGTCFYNRSDFKHAISDLTRANEIAPEKFTFQVELAMSYEFSGNFEKPLKLYQEAVTRDPGSADAWFQFACYRWNQKRYKEALKLLNRNIELTTSKEFFEQHPETWRTILEGEYSFRGDIKSKLQDKEGAIVDYKKAIILNPDSGAIKKIEALQSAP